MITLATTARDLLLVVLAVLAGAIAAVLVVVTLQRGLRAISQRRRERFRARIRPLVNHALASGDQMPAAVAATLRALSGWRRRELAALLVEPLRVVRGSDVSRARVVAARAGLLEEWRRALDRGRWPARARAARALGAVGDSQSTPRLVALLDHAHGELRAAAVEALGAIADVTAIEALLQRVDGSSRHQQARLVEALRRIGPAVTASIVSLGAEDAARRTVMADLLAYVGGAGARVALLEWAGDSDAAVRAAAWRAIGHVGLDDRAVYHALRALRDEDPRVRAQAAQALGRSGRPDVVPYLASRLDDEWEVAAQSARALTWLGDTGMAALGQRAEAGAGHGGELARHVLWERDTR